MYAAAGLLLRSQSSLLTWSPESGWRDGAATHKSQASLSSLFAGGVQQSEKAFNMFLYPPGVLNPPKAPSLVIAGLAHVPACRMTTSRVSRRYVLTGLFVSK